MNEGDRFEDTDLGYQQRLGIVGRLGPWVQKSGVLWVRHLPVGEDETPIASVERTLAPSGSGRRQETSSPWVWRIWSPDDGGFGGRLTLMVDHQPDEVLYPSWEAAQAAADKYLLDVLGLWGDPR